MQSHIQQNRYLLSYTIEPMLELLWTEDATGENTRYKVLFPITTPLLSLQPQVFDSESHPPPPPIQIVYRAYVYKMHSALIPPLLAHRYDSKAASV